MLLPLVIMFFECFAILGYPSTMKSDDMIYEESLDHLQQEVDAGADFVITQMVFQADTLISFIKQCRGSGINVPIIPGILPIQVSLGIIYGCQSFK